MLNDVFIEQAVTRKYTPKNIIIDVLILFAAFLLAWFLIYFVFSQLAIVALLAEAGVIYGAWRLITNQHVEFEYIYTNGELDIDKVISDRKRKRLTSVSVTAFDIFEPYRAETFQKEKYQKIINAASSLSDPGTYYAAFHSKDELYCALIFVPNAKMLAEINKHRVFEVRS